MTTEDTLSLAGKVAIVTGGSSGIGAATVRRRHPTGSVITVDAGRHLECARSWIFGPRRRKHRR